VWFTEKSSGNLVPGNKCPDCGRIAGHYYTCPNFEIKEGGKSSRSKLYNATSILSISDQMYFWTFTLPSRPGEKIYQVSPFDQETGDIAVTAKFSKLLEAIAIKIKRSAPPNGINKFSYAWVSEAQMKRQAKFGGVGDIHYHLVTNRRIDVQWCQSLWDSYFPGCDTWKNSVHVEPVPRDVRSIPAYMCKYMAKGSQRPIYSRRFNCSRDLSALAPIHLTWLPDLEAITTKIVTTPTGHETAMYYFNTSQVLHRYGAVMATEKTFQTTRGGKQFTVDAIASRAFNREIKQNQAKYRLKHGLIKF
jgi:hypothetical protein